MSYDEPMDENLIRQVDDLLERGKPSDHAIINMLAEALSPMGDNDTPQADAAFQRGLEERLVARLQHRQQQQKEIPMYTTTQVPQRAPRYSFLTWAAVLIVVVLMGGFALTQLRLPQTSLPMVALQSPTDAPPHTIVIATENIRAGVEITADMVGIISLSAADYEKLRINQPDRTFYSDINEVIGQRTVNAAFWFEPIEPITLGIVENCGKSALQCVPVPEGLYTIYLPMPMIALDKVGLTAGDRVDVMTSINNQLTLLVDDVLLVKVEADKVTFAAPSWKQSGLIWLSQNPQPYTLSLHEGDKPQFDDTLVDYAYTSPEELPDDYKFDLVVGLDYAEGYKLMDSPYLLDTIQFTQRDRLMQFWLTNLEVVSITDGTEVVIRLPASDAANLDYMLGVGATLSYIPQ